MKSALQKTTEAAVDPWLPRSGRKADWRQIVGQVEAVWLRLLRQHAEGAGAPQPGALRWGPPVSGA